MTVLGIRHNQLPRGKPIRDALLNQGVGYVVITLITCVPMAVRVLHFIADIVF